MIKIVGLFLWGLLFNLSTMLKYVKISGKIRNYYEQFPENVNEFADWFGTTENLWSRVEKVEFTLTLE